MVDEQLRMHVPRAHLWKEWPDALNLRSDIVDVPARLDGSGKIPLVLTLEEGLVAVICKM